MESIAAWLSVFAVWGFWSFEFRAQGLLISKQLDLPKPKTQNPKPLNIHHAVFAYSSTFFFGCGPMHVFPEEIRPLDVDLALTQTNLPKVVMNMRASPSSTWPPLALTLQIEARF